MRRKPGGFGLQAQTTGGLIGKIILLAVVTAIAVWLAIPLIATEMWVLLAIVIVTTVALYVIYLQPVPHPDQVPRAGHDLPDRVPGRPGRSSRRRPPSPTSVTATAGPKRRRSPRSSAASRPAGRGLDRVRPDHRRGRRRRHRRPRVPARRPRATMTAQQGDAEGLTPLPDAVLNERGKVTEAPEGLVLLSADEVGARSDGARDVLRPDRERGDQEPGPEPGLRGQPRHATYDEACDCITDSATGDVWTADNDRGFVRRPRTGRRCHRAGRSTSGWPTSRAPSPTRPCPARS